MKDHENAWVVYQPGGANEHLSAETREAAEAWHEATERRRGPAVARVVVDVYSNGEAVPQVQFPAGTLLDEQATAEAVRAARDALTEWE
ncbi:MAG TPA: hypothetical protein VFZ30_03810 [Acidimicrobiales bacterium]